MYDLFSEFFNAFDMFPEQTVYTKEIRCPVCKRTYNDFRNTGRLGCPECYNTFRSPLTSTMRQIHQNPVYKGKIPSHSSSELKAKKHLEELKTKLSQAVKDEDYETAAKLHKEIKDIESGTKGGDR